MNLAETLWCILKRKWINLHGYANADMLFYAINRALVDIGNGVCINYSKHVV
ncbi:hypothetical protein JCM6292_2888 [Bacteroides pyogenes JCM 6292]|uniref:Uncharacterized protein n=1 Tax=Bacteroides pyogenes JCM 6292 TaxID=1235809 RepID=W4P9Q8_9BACE|nr:hypothetical protein JCM6292_2888 [Bacteroides pyogenes JCM 6292]